jgi:hypothetical protein
MNVKNLVLGVGIFIVYLLVLNFGIKAFYAAPQYEDFCSGQQYYYPSYPDLAAVKGASGVNCTLSPTPQQQDMCTRDGGYMVTSSYDANGCAESFTCDMCNKNLADAQKDYGQKVFIISIIVGIITIIIGFTILSIEPVGSALMASGVGALVYGSMSNWANLSNIWRFLLLLAALVLLVWITIRLNKKDKKGFFGFGKK